jgi:hypothetical protein
MQKFKTGDFVRIAKDLGPLMKHFQADCDAIVMYSYNDKYGGGDTKSYCLYLRGRGTSSWYSEEQLNLIEPNRIDLLKQWESEEEKDRKIKSDLDWIFENGDEVLTKPHGASVAALAKCFGLTNLWGSRGEGVTYLHNIMTTLGLAESFLKEGDKEGWLEIAESMKNAS